MIEFAITREENKMLLTKEEWLAPLRKTVSERDACLLDAAYEVLKRNTVHEKSAPWGDVPVISPWSGPCAGIWNWDSAFHAMAVSRYDTALAKSCIDAFINFQLPTGMFPDVIYVDGRICDNYGKPPVLPWATMIVYRRDGDRDFLRRCYDRYARNAAFWEENRRDRGLFFYSAQQHPEAENYLHPRWESGWDNSPRWDEFPIIDLWAIDLNCYMVMFYRAMAEAAEILGEEKGVWLDKAAALAERIEEELFDPAQGAYADRNRKNGMFVTVLSPASFMPLFIGTASRERAEAMARLAADPKKFYPGMPTVTYDCSAYSTDYWRGQTWLNVAFFAYKGLYDYGFTKVAEEIREFILSMVYDGLSRGISENYDSIERRGRFNNSFSWSAAFVMEFILERS